MLDPFREANPDLDLKTASFDSNKAAAAKLAGGFEADVVEVCTDEMEPLTARGLLRPLDEKAVPEFHDLAFSDAPEVRDAEGNVLFVPASAGPQGLIVNTDQVDPGTIGSYADLFDPQYAGNVALEATPLTAIGAGALAMGIDDPMNLSDDEVEQVKEYLLDHRDQFRSFADSDASMVNLFKSGEVELADGGRGTTQTMIEDGVPVQWVAPKEGSLSWVCGLAITSKAQNIDAAYKLLNYYASPEAQAHLRRHGLRRDEPEGPADGQQGVQGDGRPAQPQGRDPGDGARERRRLRPGMAGGAGGLMEGAAASPPGRSRAAGLRRRPSRHRPRRFTARSATGSAGACRDSPAASWSRS